MAAYHGVRADVEIGPICTLWAAEGSKGLLRRTEVNVMWGL